MTPQELKNSILQRAVQGKLVEQRKKEGTASDLLKKIHAEKERLIKEKKIKKSKPLPEITDDEKPFDIPKNWEWIRLGELCSKIGSGSTPKGGRNSGVYQKTGIPLFREQNIYNTGIRYNGTVYISTELSLKRPNSKVIAKDILLNITGGSIGRCALVSDEFDQGDVNQHILIIRLIDKRLRKYIHAYICSPLGQSIINKKSVGAKAGFSAEKCKNMVVALPPLSEQQRIVGKIKEIVPYIDQYDQVYTKLTDLNQRFPEDIKKSILQYAMQGKLVEQRPEEGTAADLLKEIHAEKERLVKEKKIKKSKPLPEIDNDEIPFDIPDNWIWCRLNDIFDISTGLTFNKVDKCNIPNMNESIRVLRGGNILDNYHYKIDNNDVFVPYNKYASKCITLNAGDIITPAVTSMEKMCKVALIDKDLQNITAGGFVYIVKAINKQLLLPKYAAYFLSSDVNKNLCKPNIHKSGQAFYNLRKSGFIKQVFPLPPLAEQYRIVERIDKIMKKINNLIVWKGL